MSIDDWKGVTGRVPPVQARPAPAAHAGIASLFLAVLLAGCSSGTSLNPVDWWHGLQAGPIADVRPPPPEADAPYPDIGSVPKRPPPADVASRSSILSGLVADRANARYTAAQSPIGTVPPPAVPPKRATAAQAADSDDTSGATLQAASAAPVVAPVAPPSTITSPRRASVGKVDQAVPAASIPSSGAVPPAQPAATQPMPAIPGAPPPPPRLAGVAATTAPAPPAPKPPTPVAAVAPLVPGGPVSVAFEPGSAVLPPDTAAAIAQLAKTRGARNVAVTGFGDASATDSSSQSAALPLALARARAITSSLTVAGVPAAAVTLGAQALGHGGVAQIVN